MNRAFRSFRAHNSAVECVLHTDEVAGSIPAAPTSVSTKLSHLEAREEQARAGGDASLAAGDLDLGARVVDSRNARQEQALASLLVAHDDAVANRVELAELKDRPLRKEHAHLDPDACDLLEPHALEAWVARGGEHRAALGLGQDVRLDGANRPDAAAQSAIRISQGHEDRGARRGRARRSGAPELAERAPDGAARHFGQLRADLVEGPHWRALSQVGGAGGQPRARAIVRPVRWALPLLLLSGCSATFSEPAVAPGERHSRWTSSFLYGSVGRAEVDVREVCGCGRAREVESGANALTIAISVATLGIYTPRRLLVTCEASP
jgi:hypothetical protein